MSLPDLDRLDDTGRIAAARRDLPSDPAKALGELAVRSRAHEWWDRVRFGIVVAAITGIGATVGWLVHDVQAQAEDAASDRATLADIHDRMVRIEGLLMERRTP